MRTTLGLILSGLLWLGALPALANGYDVHAAPLAWSPAGTQIAAAVASDGLNLRTLVDGELRLYDRYANYEVLAAGNVGSPCFSPDGKALAAVVNGDVVVYQLADLSAEQITSSGDVLDCSWGVDRVDGAPVLNYSHGERFYGCNMVSILWERRELVEWPKPHEEGSSLGFRIGPDGEYIVYLWQPGFLEAEFQGSDLDHAYERVRVRGPGQPQDRQATRRQQREWDYHECNPVFLGDSRIVMQRGGWDEWNLFTVELESGAELPLTAGGQHPSATADGRYVAFSRWTGFNVELGEGLVDRGVWLIDCEQYRELQLSDPQTQAGLPAISADGMRIAWLQTDALGQARLVTRSLRGITYPVAPLVIPPDAPEAPLPDQADHGPVTHVVLETTKGEIVLAVHHDWAPIGAERYLNLVESGYYDGAPWFRVIDGFVAQCGIAADPEINVAWDELTIQDDPVVMGNLPGRVAFGKTGEPHSRTTHIYINFADNSRLDAKDFACFAEVIEGMEVALALHRCEFDDQAALAGEGGMELFREAFPEADYTVRAYIKE